MKTLKLLGSLSVALISISLISLPSFAADCNRPPSGSGSSWARAYEQWCRDCCGSVSGSGPRLRCNPGSNWGCRGSQGSGSPAYGSQPGYSSQPSYDYEADHQRQLEADRQRQREIDEQRKRDEEEARRRQEEFDRNKRDALNSMKSITENELGLKGSGAGELGLKGAGDTGIGLGLKEMGDPSVVDLRDKKKPYEMDLNVVKGVNISNVKVQKGVADPKQLRRDLLANCADTVLERTRQTNTQAQDIMRSFKTKEPPSPVKNISDLAPGDVVLVAPWSLKDRKKAGDWEVGVSTGINLLDKWGSNNWSSPASHAAIFLGVRNGKRYYLDNTGHGPMIKEEKYFLQEYGARKMDVATLVGQPLSRHEGDEMWKGAKEMIKTTSYGPSKFSNLSGDAGMVCSESARWLLLRAGRKVPETRSESKKILGKDTGLSKKQFVDFSPSDFYEEQQYFVVHQLSIQQKAGENR